ncbi:MAG: hypothetical protein AAFZ80_03170 [Cyanobacteria bacterium P01_A01_bin.105]
MPKAFMAVSYGGHDLLVAQQAECQQTECQQTEWLEYAQYNARQHQFTNASLKYYWKGGHLFCRCMPPQQPGTRALDRALDTEPGVCWGR